MIPPGNCIMAKQNFRILVINPGSTSTKVSLFEDDKMVLDRNVFHDSSVLLAFAHVNDQLDFRKKVVVEALEADGVRLDTVDAFVGRGGSACTQPGGITVIDEKLFNDTVAGVGGSEHPAKLGVMLAWRLARDYDRPAFTIDPTNVDEYCDLARLTGIKGVYRTPHSHVLNQKAVAKAYAAKLGKRYEDLNLIVAHIDGGITVAAHEHGKMIDGSMGADGEGAFTPTRIGSVPVLQLLDYIEAHSVEDVRLRCSRAGGFVDLFGTSDSDKIHALVDKGDRKATLVWQTMIYQICKMIGSMSVVLCGKVDAILLTGGLLRFADVAEGIRCRCGFIAPIETYPGEMEQEAMALPALKVLRGEIEPKRYCGHNVWSGFGDIGL